MTTTYRVTTFCSQTTVVIEGEEVCAVYDEEGQTQRALTLTLSEIFGKDPRIVIEKDGTEERTWHV